MLHRTNYHADKPVQMSEEEEVETMNERRRLWSLGIAAPVLALLLVLTGCGDDDDADPESDTSAADTGADTAAGAGDTSEAGAGNACPPDGCTIAIAAIGADAGAGELVLTFDANFSPDIAGNHFHVYWDTFEADQVSSDAADRGVTQGDWHPTDEYPDYTTTEATSVSQRGESATLCVTAGDRDHAVIDATAVNCVDATTQLDELSS
jgi:hypothetical protein